jgi:diacylglycerol kinase family enzyme
MLVHSMRSSSLRLVPSAQPATEPKVAVLLNANARKVTDKVVRTLSHVVPEEDMFLSQSLSDCRRISQTVIERGYDVVFTGGGDGTFIGYLNEIRRQLEVRSRYFPQRTPRFGVLRLGTGNGLASLVNASTLRGDGILDDVLRARAGEVPGYRRLDLIEVDGKLSPFSGLGIDGKLLNDYIWVKENLGRGAFRRLLTGPGGYFSAVAMRTVPHYMTHSTLVECEVRNGDQGPAYRLQPDGSVMGEVGPGELLFRGKLMMCAAATMPFYGYAFRMFPFATRRPGAMHLRLAAVNALEVLSNLSQMWKGRWFKEGRLFDYHVRGFNVRFARPMPFQIGGDAEGYRSEVSMRVSPEPVELVDYSGAVH